MRTPANAMAVANTSDSECTASEIIAAELPKMPAASLNAESATLPPMPTAATWREMRERSGSGAAACRSAAAGVPVAVTVRGPAAAGLPVAAAACGSVVLAGPPSSACAACVAVRQALAGEFAGAGMGVRHSRFFAMVLMFILQSRVRPALGVSCAGSTEAARPRRGRQKNACGTSNCPAGVHVMPAARLGPAPWRQGHGLFRLRC